MISSHRPKIVAAITALCLAVAPHLAADAKPLFDGKTLTGWDGDEIIWRVADGMITGGSLDEKVARNEFIATTRSYQNYELRLKLKISGTEGFINSGVQIR